MPLSPDWREFFEALLAANVEFVVVGALAVSVHAEPRYSEDLDVLVRPSLANGKRLRRALVAFGFGAGIRPEEILDPRRIWMLGRKPFRIDIITSIDGVTWEEAWKGHVDAPVDGFLLPVLGVHELVRNKRAAGRDKDLRDLDSIARVTGIPIDQALPKAKAHKRRRK